MMPETLSDLPVCRRVKREIERMIDAGVLHSGGLVPGERELAHRFGAARGTVRQAIAKLVADGKLVRIARKGTVVAPNVSARRGSGAWAVVVPILHYFYPLLVTYIEREAAERGAALQIGCSYDSVQREREQVFRAIENGARGILLAPACPRVGRTRESFEYLADLPAPVVIMDHWGANLPLSGLDAVLSDNFAGCYQMTVHLIRHGYTRIGMAGREEPGTIEMDERYRGYRSALEDHGLEVPPLAPVDTRGIGHGRVETIREHLDWGVQAIVVTNDRSALTLISRLREFGVRVPEDVAVTGYDDEPFAAMVVPKLTSVRVEKAEIARRAIELLVQRLDEAYRGPARTVVLRPTVVARQTCSPHCPEYDERAQEENAEIDMLRAAGV
ncbi:MAG: GntR family transcriptional regulator [Phycisphaerae bacterium]|nr:GntR family transcriptional regulator [Phycisphaerae bacterium]